jgi:RHS repeat-associated protein
MYSGSSVVASYEYDAFGRLLRESEIEEDLNPFRFSTKYTDAETGFAYYGYRFYDAVRGRWLNKDPIGEIGGVNTYAIVGNNLISRSDFLGLVDINLLSKWPKFGLWWAMELAFNNMDNYITVGAHGNASAIGSQSNGKPLTAEMVAEIVMNHPKWDWKRQVYLVACKSGGKRKNGGPNFAQQLANILGVVVYAPDTNVKMWPDGYSQLGSDCCSAEEIRGENIEGSYIPHRPQYLTHPNEPVTDKDLPLVPNAPFKKEIPLTLP